MLYSQEELKQYLEEPSSLDRMFVGDQVNWTFLNRVACGTISDANPVEREIAALERWQGKAAALRRLAELGIVTILENPGVVLAEKFRQQRQRRHEEQSRWARGRRTRSG